MVQLKKDRSYLIMLILFIAWIIGYCDKSAINVAVIPIAKEFHFSSTQTGLILSSFFTSYAVMTLFGGFLADKFGSRKVLTLIMVFWSFFTGMTGFAWSLTSFMVIRFMFGAAEGGFPSASSVTIAELYPPEKRGRAKSFIVSASQVGTALGTFIVSAFIVTIGWRWAFKLYAILGILVALAFFFIFKSDKKAGDAAQQTKAKVPLRNILKIPLVWKLIVMQFALGAFAWGLGSWLPSYWVTVKHLSMVQMGSMTAIVAIITFGFMNLAGFLIDKFFVGKERVLLCILLAIGGFFVFLMYSASTVVLAFTYLTIANIAIGMCSPIVFSLALKYLPKEFIGTGTGIANFGQQSAGIVAPTLFGFMIQASHGSYITVFGFIVALCVIALVVAATVNTKKQIEDGSAKAAE